MAYRISGLPISCRIPKTAVYSARCPVQSYIIELRSYYLNYIYNIYKTRYGGGGGGYSGGGGSRYGGGGGGGGGKFDNPGQKLKAVDWGRHTLSVLKKDFYTPSPAVTNRLVIYLKVFFSKYIKRRILKPS